MVHVRGFYLTLAAISHTAAQPTGSCSSNHTPCPPPTWAPVWNLTMSTLCQPSAVGYFEMPAAQPWGLVSLDWSVARSIWQKNGNAKGTVEATSIEGCRQLKAVSPNTKCFMCVYIPGAGRTPDSHAPIHRPAPTRAATTTWSSRFKRWRASVW
jgi:hypothetical protein